MLCIETDGFYSDAQCSDHFFALTSRPIIQNIKNSVRLYKMWLTLTLKNLMIYLKTLLIEYIKNNVV